MHTSLEGWERTVTVLEPIWGGLIALAVMLAIVILFLIAAVRDAERRATRAWKTADAAIDIQPGLRKGLVELAGERYGQWNADEYRLLRDFQSSRATVIQADKQRKLIEQVTALTKEHKTE